MARLPFLPRMPLKLTERRIDHNSRALPKGVYALAREDGTIASYKVRWREESEEGVRRNAGKSFWIRKFGSRDRALEAWRASRAEPTTAADRGAAVLRADPAASLAVDELFQEGCVKRAPSLSKRYAED